MTENSKVDVEKVKELFLQLTDEERLEIMSECCKFCGCLEPRCQCWNDE